MFVSSGRLRRVLYIDTPCYMFSTPSTKRESLWRRVFTVNAREAPLTSKRARKMSEIISSTSGNDTNQEARMDVAVAEQQTRSRSSKAKRKAEETHEDLPESNKVVEDASAAVSSKATEVESSTSINDTNQEAATDAAAAGQVTRASRYKRKAEETCIESASVPVRSKAKKSVKAKTNQVEEEEEEESPKSLFISKRRSRGDVIAGLP